MPKIRIGLSTDFNLVNEQVGIGTTSPTSRVDVAGQILADNTSGGGGISTFREYQGFAQVKADISNNITIDGGSYNSLTGEIVISGQTTISSGSTVEVGKVKSLTVTDKFAVPVGETGNRENTPEAGTIRFNQDFKTLEFFDGANWKTVNSYATPGRGRVIIAGGYGRKGIPAGSPGVKTMQSLQVMSLGNSSYFGELEHINTEHIGCGSEIRGLFGGGYVAGIGRVDYIQDVTLASQGNADDFGNLTEGRNQAQAVSSSTRATWAGGFASGLRSVIDYVEISTIGNAIQFGDLTETKSTGAVANSPTRGIFIGGYPIIQKTEYITIASTGNAVEFGESGHIVAGSNCGSSTRGIFGGGYHRNPAPSARHTLSYITMATLGQTVNFGELTNTMVYASAGGNQTRGIFTGSQLGTPYANNNIEYVSVSSLGDAKDFGDLTNQTAYAGAVSDSHGGLGGF